MGATRVLAAAKSAVASAVKAVTQAAPSTSDSDRPTPASAVGSEPPTPAKKAPVKKAPVKKGTAKKTSVSKAPAKKPAASKTAATKPAVKKAPAAKTAAKKAPASKKAPARKSAAERGLVVREGESAWTAAEIRAVRAELESDISQLRRDVDQAEIEIVDLMRDSGDGAGDDQADAGTKTYEREQELALADNARDLLRQSEHALARMDDGTYGVCESCGQPIGKLRLQAAPRATLCMPCKKKQERR